VVRTRPITLRVLELWRAVIYVLSPDVRETWNMSLVPPPPVPHTHHTTLLIVRVLTGALDSLTQFARVVVVVVVVYFSTHETCHRPAPEATELSYRSPRRESSTRQDGPPRHRRLAARVGGGGRSKCSVPPGSSTRLPRSTS